MASLVDIASKLVLTFHDSMLETVLAILVVDAFHGWIIEHLESLVYLHKLLVCLSFLLSGAAHRMVLQ